MNSAVDIQTSVRRMRSSRLWRKLTMLKVHMIAQV